MFNDLEASMCRRGSRSFLAFLEVYVQGGILCIFGMCLQSWNLRGVIGKVVVLLKARWPSLNFRGFHGAVVAFRFHDRPGRTMVTSQAHMYNGRHASSVASLGVPWNNWKLPDYLGVVEGILDASWSIWRLLCNRRSAIVLPEASCLV